MVSVSLVKWCNNRFSNRDIAAIHHQLIVVSYQIDLGREEHD
jgi:hypothetical protein